MAEGMIAGIVRSGQMPLSHIYATNKQNKQRLNELTKRYGIQTATMDSFPFEEMDMLILAMKPKMIQKKLFKPLSTCKNKQKKSCQRTLLI